MNSQQQVKLPHTKLENGRRRSAPQPGSTITQAQCSYKRPKQTTSKRNASGADDNDFLLKYHNTKTDSDNPSPPLRRQISWKPTTQVWQRDKKVDKTCTHQQRTYIIPRMCEPFIRISPYTLRDPPSSTTCVWNQKGVFYFRVLQENRPHYLRPGVKGP